MKTDASSPKLFAVVCEVLSLSLYFFWSQYRPINDPQSETVTQLLSLTCYFKKLFRLLHSNIQLHNTLLSSKSDFTFKSANIVSLMPHMVNIVVNDATTLHP